MIGRQNSNSRTFIFSRKRTEQLDPRYLEVHEARRKMALISLQSSYASRSDTHLWAFMIWAASAFALAPFQTLTVASVFALLIALAWTTVHNARRA